jgi:aldehyde dehydrogenase (NAD+)
MSKRKVGELFESMEYGPAPESADNVHAWLDTHDRKLGLFINNQFVKPEGRKTLDSKDPATGKVLAATMQC